MRDGARILIMAIALALTGCGGGDGASGGGAGCPSADEVRKSVEAFERKNQLTEHNREIWHVQDLRNFSFSEMKFGDMTDEQVNWGASAQEVCPVRFTYTYELVETDGAVKPKNFGEGLTFFFYRDAFKEWTYRYGS
jgi:hypothetical protein